MTLPKASRECGSCSYCCTHVAVKAFDKPVGTPCQHLLPIIPNEPCAGACGIYADRPSECKMYRCSWLEGNLPEELKPDKCGLLFETGWIEWPHKVTMLMGFEHVAGALGKYEHLLEAAAVDGKVIVVIPKDGDAGTLFAEEKDGLAYMQFMDACRQHGGVTHVFADGNILEDKFEPELKGS